MTETINFKTQLDALSDIYYNLQLAGVQLYHQKHLIIQSLTILDYNYKLGFFSGACNIVNLNINLFFLTAWTICISQKQKFTHLLIN